MFGELFRGIVSTPRRNEPWEALTHLLQVDILDFSHVPNPARGLLSPNRNETQVHRMSGGDDSIAQQSRQVTQRPAFVIRKNGHQMPQPENERDADSNVRDELVVLIHGLASKRFWMRPLEQRIRRHGYNTYNWGYRSLRRSLHYHADRLRQELEQRASQTQRIHIVAHSMGAIITRLVLSPLPSDNIGRVVFLAPPNHGSPVARFFGPLVRPVNPTMSEISSRSDSVVNRIGRLNDVTTGVIGARFDMLVPWSSTILEGQTDRILLPATHNSLLIQYSSFKQILAFLAHGAFEH